MDRSETLRILAAHKNELRAMGVKSLALFGSTARGEARTDSDVDLLVEFDENARVGLFEMARIQRRLSALLEAKVDLVTRNGLRKEYRDAVLSEAIHA